MNSPLGFPSPTRGFFSLALAVAGLFAPVLRAADEAPVSDKVIELPKFIVTDSRILPDPESWRYARIADFEILTNASDKATQRLIRDFEMFRFALSQIWRLPEESHTPSTMILCARDKRFESFLSERDRKTGAPVVSLFVNDQERSAIVMDLQTRSLTSLAFDSSDTTGTISEINVDYYKQLYREYVHYLMSRIEPRAPAWFEEGLAQIIMAMKVDQHSIVFGKVEDPNTVSAIAGLKAMTAAATTSASASSGANLSISSTTDSESDAVSDPTTAVDDRDFPAALDKRALMPMEKLFAVQHGDPATRTALGNDLWAKQSYAFVHLCLYGARGRLQTPLVVFLSRCAREPVTEAMFKECFGMKYRDMLLMIRGYVQYTDSKYQEYRVRGKGFETPAPIELRDATDTEIGYLKGEALRLAGNIEASRNTLIASYQRGSRDPRLLASLGLSELAAGERDRARKFLEAAVKGNVVRPRAYVELARLRLAEAAGTGKLADTQLASVLELLFAARDQQPPMPEVYELIGDAWDHGVSAPTAANLNVLKEGVMLFPRRTGLVLEAAELYAKNGFTKDASPLVAFGLRTATDPTMRERLLQLQSTLPPEPKVPPVPAAPAKSGSG